MIITSDQLKTLAPHSKFDPSIYASLITASLSVNEINTKLRMAHFMAQILEESGGFTRFEEDLSYSTAQRLFAVWPSRFTSLQDAASYTHNPQKLANHVYNGRNGNTEPNDGWTFHGRGPIQLTGRALYTQAAKELGKDYVNHPEYVLQAGDGVLTASWFFKMKGCLPHADKDDIVTVTKLVNGGLTNIDERKAYLQRTKQIWH